MAVTKPAMDLDVNKLYEEITIKEIEQIQKKIQYDSDRKKIELRTLVGERYRDLIQAADTIAEMEKTADNVVAKIVHIEDTFQKLQEKYLIGFKVEPPQSENKTKSTSALEAIVVQIKILMDIPEQMWSSVDNNNLLQAAQLFLLARYVNYNLKFEIGEEKLTKSYSVVNKQWRIISQFKDVIFKSSDKVLKSADLTIEAAVNSLASLVLLSEASSKELLKKLLVMRNLATESIIDDESHHSVRTRLKLCVQLLIQTVVIIHRSFINADGNFKGLLTKYIEDLKDTDALTMLHCLSIDENLINKFLPQSMRDHKPFQNLSIVNISREDAQECIKDWLNWVKNFTYIKVSELLNLVTTIKGVYNIREEIFGLNFPSNWNTIWEEISLPATNFWIEFFQPLLTKRVEEIIDNNWGEVLDNVKTSISELLVKVSNEKYDFPENDLRWFVWKDSPMDIPQKLMKNGELDYKRSLLMKTRGYSPNVVKLCDNFDKSLNPLLVDLEQYLHETERITTIKDELLALNNMLSFNAFSDKTEIQEHLQKVSEKNIRALIDYIHSECVCEHPKFGKREINSIVMARFIQALLTLCPNLNKHCTLSKISGLVKWQSLCDFLKEQSILVWCIWASIYKEKLKDYQMKHLGQISIEGNRINLFSSEWEKVTIEEEAEEGKCIKSEILVPYQPSIPLQKYLATVSRDLNKAVPHTLPKKVLHEIVEDLADKLLDYYSNACGGKDLRQKQAFQVLFDIKYATLLMIPRENKRLCEKSNQVCELIISKIDPFDLDVYYPFIYTNIKRSIQRSLLILGNLILHLEQLHSVLGARSEYSGVDSGKSVEDPPGVLAVCSGAPWFPPLTITAPSRNLPLMQVAIPESSQKRKSNKDQGRSDSAGTAIKSGAAAFFGAMGSDWFGGS